MARAIVNTVSFQEVGSYLITASAVTPANYLYCDGSSLLRATYTELFAKIGTAHGAADGTHFNLPDCRGRFVRGQADGSANDPDRSTRTAMATGGATGDNVGSVQINATKKNGLSASAGNESAHTHIQSKAVGGGSLTRGYAVYMSSDGILPDTSAPTQAGTAHNHTITVGEGDNETRPLNINVRYYIRYQK